MEARNLIQGKNGANRERVILESMYHWFKVQPGLGHRHDPFHYLPLELVLMICQKLEIRDLLVCLTVSKGWKRLLESLRTLWTTLDTAHIRRAIPIGRLRAYLKRSKYNLKRARIRLKPRADKRRLQHIIEASRHLKELEIHGGCTTGSKYLKDLEMRGGCMFDETLNLFSTVQEIEKLYISEDFFISLPAALVVLKTCRITLVEVTILHIQVRNWQKNGASGEYRWPKLDTLTSISLGSSDRGSLDINRFLETYPNVTTVSLKGFEILPKTRLDLRSRLHLERLDLMTAGLSDFPLLPQTLRHLDLGGNLNLSLTSELEKDIVPLPLLESFSCHWTLINARSLFAITQSCIEANNLKSLGVGCRGRVLNISTLAVSEEFPPSSSLEKLSIANLSLEDVHVLEILPVYPRLKEIDLSGNRITIVTIKALIDKSSIERIKIIGCFDVDLDAIEMAVRCGIHVDSLFLTI